MQPSALLPKWLCHKVVAADKITEAVKAGDGGAYTILTLSQGAKMMVDASWIARHKAEVGGYFVQYDDGYQSFSPAAAFEGGYSLLPDPQST